MRYYAEETSRDFVFLTSNRNVPALTVPTGLRGAEIPRLTAYDVTAFELRDSRDSKNARHVAPDPARPPIPPSRILMAVRTLTLYLDTSVRGGYFDDEWKEATRELWRQMEEEGRFRFVTSAVTADELAAAPENVRDLFADTFLPDDLVPSTAEAEHLAAHYIAQAVLNPKYTDDARHVAACTVARLDYLVSWNFRHLVNVQRAAGFNAVNLLQGYPPVCIVNPLELIYGNPDQDL